MNEEQESVLEEAELFLNIQQEEKELKDLLVLHTNLVAIKDTITTCGITPAVESLLYEPLKKCGIELSVDDVVVSSENIIIKILEAVDAITSRAYWITVRTAATIRDFNLKATILDVRFRKLYSKVKNIKQSSWKARVCSEKPGVTITYIDLADGKFANLQTEILHLTFKLYDSWCWQDTEELSRSMVRKHIDKYEGLAHKNVELSKNNFVTSFTPTHHRHGTEAFKESCRRLDGFRSTISAFDGFKEMVRDFEKDLKKNPNTIRDVEYDIILSMSKAVRISIRNILSAFRQHIKILSKYIA